MNPADQIAAKMRTARVAEPAITAFLRAVSAVRSGASGVILENSIEPIRSLPTLANLRPPRTSASLLLQQLAVIKLNGGLGTSMGLDRAKSLIRVKGEDTFLDFIAKQILHLRHKGGSGPAFYLMNSFATREDSLRHLARYADLPDDEKQLDFLQNKVPKLDPATLVPVEWPGDPELEWCPPGHGDIYPALVGSGLMRLLLRRGIKYLFVSNADNLGATVDLRLAAYFAESNLSFLMEVAERTEADKKGGHLARRRSDGRFILRESVQCSKEDASLFQDVDRHRFFNTNNLWIQLEHLESELNKSGGALNLPLIKNQKNVDPRDPQSPVVLQLESAMGAAIECFKASGAIVVPRTRFSPVKTTSDLLALRSDAYCVRKDFSLALAESRRGEPPLITLDASHYKLIADFEKHFTGGSPSLIECESMKVDGNIDFAPGVVCRGRLEFFNPGPEPKRVPEGTFWDQRIEF
jgi:UDP-N-acetylglucosamine pyrophosphorylase